MRRYNPKKAGTNHYEKLPIEGTFYDTSGLENGYSARAKIDKERTKQKNRKLAFQIVLFPITIPIWILTKVYYTLSSNSSVPPGTIPIPKSEEDNIGI